MRKTESKEDRQLRVARQQRMRELNQAIEAGIEAVKAAGRSLRTIRDERLYEPSFDGFDDYCLRMWDLSPRWARKIIEVAGEPEGDAVARMLPGHTKNEAPALAPRLSIASASLPKHRP